MTQKIIICILLLVTVSSGINKVSAGQNQVHQLAGQHISNQASSQMTPTQDTKIPLSPAHQNDVPHGKAARIPHMEELPHIHRYHKERVKKLRAHHGKCWFLGRAIVVICHLSLLWIAYMHLTH